MQAISGVFKTRAGAEHAIREAQNAGVPPDRVALLSPGTTEEVNRELKQVPVDAAEQPGMGTAVGALVGGAAGLASGTLLALVPGVGPVTALGLLGSAILGLAGAGIGGSIGRTSEASLSRGLPEDEIFVYEDALRKGRSVVIALAGSDDNAALIRDLLRVEGAESVDAAREQWWIGLRSAEENRYSKSGGNFGNDEAFYRRGFEAALHARSRSLETDEPGEQVKTALEDLQRQHPGAQVAEPFMKGYRRGREHYRQTCDQAKAA